MYSSISFYDTHLRVPKVYPQTCRPRTLEIRCSNSVIQRVFASFCRPVYVSTQDSRNPYRKVRYVVRIKVYSSMGCIVSSFSPLVVKVFSIGVTLSLTDLLGPVFQGVYYHETSVVVVISLKV